MYNIPVIHVEYLQYNMCMYIMYVCAEWGALWDGNGWMVHTFSRHHWLVVSK